MSETVPWEDSDQPDMSLSCVHMSEGMLSLVAACVLSRAQVLLA